MLSSTLLSRAVLLGCVCGVTACGPVLHMQVPSPRGALGVGRSTIILVDSTRADPWIPTERRVVVVQTWYPAEAESSGPRAPYLANAGELPGNFDRGERWAVSRLSSHARVQPPVANASPKYPVIVFSPGNDMATEYYSALLEELASRGYVVLALDHAHEGKGQILPDGRRLTMEVDKQRPPENVRAILDFYRKRVEQRTADAVFVLARLPSLADSRPLVARIDFTRVGALGHSIGGVTAAEMCRRDQRILACENLDGLVNAKPILSENASYALAQPFLYLGKPLPFKNPAVNDSARRELRAAIGSGAAGAYDVTIDETHHDTFSDSPFMMPTFHPTRNRANLEVIRDVTIAFFDKTLRGRPAPILDQATSMYNGRVTIWRSGI